MFDTPFDMIELKTHPDQRGNLFEILRFQDQHIPGEGYLYCLTLVPGARRGDHYHERKREWFTCVAGAVTVLAEEKYGTQHKVVLDAEHPAVLYFAPFTAHTLLNTGSVLAVVVSYGSKQYDPDDTDTFPKVIEYKGA